MNAAGEAAAPDPDPRDHPQDRSDTRTDTRTDTELLRAHADGDTDAFGVLFARHRDRLWAVALRTTGNREDAADGLQDGLVAAYRRAGSFRGEAAVTTWLHRVVVNACLDRLRAAKVRRTEPLPDELDQNGERHGERHARAGDHRSAEDTADPADLSVAAERRRAVLDALATLPDDQRAALVLVDMEGYPVAEVARILGCPTGTVKSRCSRGRARLVVLLGDLVGAGDRAHPDPGNPPPTSPVRSSTAPRGPPTPPSTATRPSTGRGDT